MSQHINPTPKQTDVDSLNSNIASKTFTPTSDGILLSWLLDNIPNRNGLPFSFVKTGSATVSDSPFSVATTEFVGIVYGNARRMVVELQRYTAGAIEKWSRCIFDDDWHGDWKQ